MKRHFCCVFTRSLTSSPFARLLGRGGVLRRLLALSLVALALTWGRVASAQYTTLDDPNSGTGLSGGTYPQGINARGQIVGYYFDNSGIQHGFLLSKGVYTPLDDPEGVYGTTAAYGINSQSQIVGDYADSNGIVQGFVLSKGIYITLDGPSGVYGYIAATGINDHGQIVGEYVDSNDIVHGFLFSQGVYTTLDDPNAGTGLYQGTAAFGINDRGQIMGEYADNIGSGQHGFLFSP